jgi:hypothetical protein
MYAIRKTKLSESCAAHDGPVLAAQAEQRDEKGWTPVASAQQLYL